MTPADFRKIDSYFTTKGKAELSQLAYAIYVENVEDALKRLPNPQADVEVRRICDNYLTDAQMKNYLAVAEKADETKRLNSSRHAMAFWLSVGSSIVANIIFAIVLYGFYVAVVGPSSNQILDETRQRVSDINR